MIVIELWSHNEVAVFSPYNRDFVADLKALGNRSMRHWEPDHKAWVVRTALFEDVHKLLDDYFPNEEWAVADDAKDAIQMVYHKQVNPGGAQASSAPSGPPTSFGPYATLYINNSAPDAVVKAAHKALTRLYHPDLGGDPKAMGAVNAAFEDIKKERGGL